MGKKRVFWLIHTKNKCIHENKCMFRQQLQEHDKRQVETENKDVTKILNLFFFLPEKNFFSHLKLK